MRNDIGSNYTLAEALSALSRGAGSYKTASVNHRDGSAASFFLSCGTFSTSLTATVQHSPDDTTFTDEADTTLGNEVSGTLTDTGTIQLDIPNPRALYSRLNVVLGGTCVVGVTSVLGPLKHVSAG